MPKLWANNNLSESITGSPVGMPMATGLKIGIILSPNS